LILLLNVFNYPVNLITLSAKSDSQGVAALRFINTGNVICLPVCLFLPLNGDSGRGDYCLAGLMNPSTANPV
ncbi:hypothetical protein KKJ06_22655, partial [Xenorhabdus bovienii]